MPSLSDPNFSQTVTYVCEHNEKGAMGIVINRPLDLTLGEVLSHMQITAGQKLDVKRPVLIGGPVQGEHGFVLHTPVGQWSSSLEVSDGIAVTTSRDILLALADGKGPEHFLVALGYAGWDAGQLEKEMAENAWLSGPADSHVLFDVPLDKRWIAAAALLGIDLNLLSSDVGHA
jgi:putative transcriptional regulator